MKELLKELNELRNKFTGIEQEQFTENDFQNVETIKEYILYYKGKLLENIN